MIDIQEVLLIHETLIAEFGGVNGVRDYNLLVSAINRPFAGTNDSEFYPTTHLKAAAVIERIVKNHPFIDGNKRTGYVVMRLFLLSDGLDINASQDEKYEFVIEIATGNSTIDDITSWILNHLIQL
ncbi:MAG TPA: type II toxin-antitoxin system death-on-curing family toxin [Chitinophagaceae bacterium]|nr:type II toxin-antitoxin system death-on-curing family toxin [Chitinophagaceae bacterium]